MWSPQHPGAPGALGALQQLPPANVHTISPGCPEVSVLCTPQWEALSEKEARFWGGTGAWTPLEGYLLPTLNRVPGQSRPSRLCLLRESWTAGELCHGPARRTCHGDSQGPLSS